MIIHLGDLFECGLILQSCQPFRPHLVSAWGAPSDAASMGQIHPQGFKKWEMVPKRSQKYVRGTGFSKRQIWAARSAGSSNSTFWEIKPPNSPQVPKLLQHGWVDHTSLHGKMPLSAHANGCTFFHWFCIVGTAILDMWLALRTEVHNLQAKSQLTIHVLAHWTGWPYTASLASSKQLLKGLPEWEP